MRKKVAVYEITDNISEISLDIQKIRNINKIFTEIIENHTNHISVLAGVVEGKESILRDFSNNINNFDIERFPSQLLNSEISSSTNERNKSIRTGFLFIKESNDCLLLLKLEKTSVANTETFELSSQLGTEKNYYKACIAKKDLSTVEIIDKNKKVATYWMDNFLGLQEVRNSKVNSIELVRLIENEELYSNDIKDAENFSEIVAETKNFIFDHNRFDKSELIDYLNSKRVTEISTDIDDYEDLFFSSEAEQLDASFDIDQKVLRDKYKDEIRISCETIIKTDNFEKLKRRNQIRIEGNKIILTVSDDFVQNVQAKIGVANG